MYIIIFAIYIYMFTAILTFEYIYIYTYIRNAFATLSPVLRNSFANLSQLLFRSSSFATPLPSQQHDARNAAVVVPSPACQQHPCAKFSQLSRNLQGSGQGLNFELVPPNKQMFQ